MTLKRWFAGFFLLILMVTALFVNSILFSARSFQDNLAHIAPATGGVIKIAEIREIEANVKQMTNQTSEQRGELAQLEIARAGIDRDVKGLRDQLASIEAGALIKTSELETAVGLTPGAGTGTFDPVDVAQRLDRIVGTRNAAPDVRDGVVKVRTDLGKMPDLEQALATNEDALAAKEAERDRTAEYVNKSDRAILGLQSQFGTDFTRVRNEADALVASTPFGLGTRIVEMHPTFLTTILVLIMGALGALLYLFPAYLNRENRIFFSDIVVRLVFGMVVALAFFIVANASIASLAFMPSDAGSASGASLNPFSVSLIGIVAGIMADDIASWILKRGRELLGGGSAIAAPRPAPAPSESGGLANPRGSAADPYASAAQDARTTHQAGPAPGDAPPRGGVVG